MPDDVILLLNNLADHFIDRMDNAQARKLLELSNDLRALMLGDLTLEEFSNAHQTLEWPEPVDIDQRLA